MNSEIKLRHDVCALLSVAQFTKITFVWSTKQQWVPETRTQVLDLGKPALHPDGRPISICTQFLRWRFGPDTVLDSHLIDIWQHGTELYVFLADANEPDETVQIKFPTFSEWAQGQRRDRIDERLITDEEYAQTIRKQAQSQFRELNLQRYPAFLAQRADIIQRYDPIELYTEHVRNSVRRYLQQQKEARAANIVFPTFKEWAHSQRELGMGPGAITEDEYAQSLAMQVWDVIKKNPVNFAQFINAEWDSLTRAGAQPIEAYKDYLRDFARRLGRQKEAAQEAAQEAKEDDVKNMTPEEWAAFISRLPTVLQSLPLLLAERTMVDAGVMSPSQHPMSIWPRVANRLKDYSAEILIVPDDTLSTLKRKVQEQTGIPADALKMVLYNGQPLTAVDQMKDFQYHGTPFTVLDMRGRR